MRIDSLESTPFELIHGCFIESFKDYAVNMTAISSQVLQRRARKNNWVPRLSSGAWDSEELIGITLVGVDEVAGENIAYDICTGVVPESRGRGLAGRMMDQIMPRLREAGVRAMQLEVLENNSPAISAYKRTGFSEVRRLVSYTRAGKITGSKSTPFEIRPIGLDELLGLSTELDFEPSFEQRDRAITHLEHELIMLGADVNGQIVAAIAYDPVTEWLMRLVSRRSNRRRGAATALINDLADRLDADNLIKAINIDASDEATRALMKSAGFLNSLGQLEMRLELA